MPYPFTLGMRLAASRGLFSHLELVGHYC